MNFKVLVVHNSDEVKTVFAGGTITDIVEKVMKSVYKDDIIERLNIPADEIGMADITELHHDGGFEDGFTLMDVE